MNPRLFRGAILETILLQHVNEAGSAGVHGYAIFAILQKYYGIRLGPSTLYPELKMLETKGLISSSWDVVSGKARRKYRITGAGQRRLMENSIELRVIVGHAQVAPLRTT
jgi:DNA-binding PadR family transcriptional regulator